MADAVSREPVTDWATDFDHFDPGFVADPYPVYRDLQARCPVAHTDRYGGMNVLTTYDDIAAALHDTATYSSRRIVPSEIPSSYSGAVIPPINFDPPAHTEPRRVMLPFFNPAATKRWEPVIRDICTRRLDDLEGRTECDLAADYGKHIPGDLTATMFGVPDSEADRFRDWIHELIEVGPTDVEVERAATHAIIDYMYDLMADRRANGGDDIVTYLFDKTIDGEPIDDKTMAKMLFLLLVAGIDTTWSALGSSFLHLATHPDDRRRLVDDPTLIPTATEEFLRAYAPVYMARVATTDAEIGGCPVAEGEWVMMALPAANRDPAVFDDPDDVRIDRQRNRHAAFGLGVHRCLGSNLARLEMDLAIEMLLERFPEFSLIEGSDVAFSAGNVRGPRAVPVRLG